MTEAPDSGTKPPTTPQQAQYSDRYERPSRPGQVLAWVGIIAGVVFIVAVIFFLGLFVGGSSGGYHGWHHRDYNGHMGPDGEPGNCFMNGPGGMMGPSQSPTTTAPSSPRP